MCLTVAVSVEQSGAERAHVFSRTSPDMHVESLWLRNWIQTLNFMKKKVDLHQFFTSLSEFKKGILLNRTQAVIFWLKSVSVDKVYVLFFKEYVEPNFVFNTAFPRSWVNYFVILRKQTVVSSNHGSESINKMLFFWILISADSIK